MDYKEIFKAIQKGDIKNIYLLYGEEKYLIDSVITKLRESLISKPMEAFNFTILEEGGETTASKITELSETLPFMDKNRMIVVKQFPFGIRQGEEAESMLAQYIIKGVPSNTYLVFVVNGDVDKRKKLVKEIKKHGELVELGRISQGDLEKWVASKLKTWGKEITLSDLKYFVGLLDYGSKNSDLSLEDVDNEIKKLVSYVGSKSVIACQDIDSITSKSISSDIFKLVDHISNKRGFEALSTLEEIIGKGEAIPKILFMISRQYRIMLQCKILLQRGYSHQEIASKLSLHPYVVKTSIHQGKAFDLLGIKQSLKNCLKADLAIKTGHMKDRVAVEVLIGNLCSVN